MESVASMDIADRKVMSEAVGIVPYRIDAAGVSLAHRPRLYWCDWELLEMEGVTLQFSQSPEWGISIKLSSPHPLNPLTIWNQVGAFKRLNRGYPHLLLHDRPIYRDASPPG